MINLMLGAYNRYYQCNGFQGKIKTHQLFRRKKKKLNSNHRFLVDSLFGSTIKTLIICTF